MNRPVPASSFTSDAPSYDQDGYGWALHQAALIRAGERVHLDWDNIAEEIESVGKSEFRATESALRVVLVHLLKWRHQPARRSRSWALSVREHLDRFDELLDDNPSLRSRCDEILVRAYRKARFEASHETGLDMDAFDASPPGWDEIRAPLEP